MLVYTLMFRKCSNVIINGAIITFKRCTDTFSLNFIQKPLQISNWILIQSIKQNYSGFRAEHQIYVTGLMSNWDVLNYCTYETKCHSFFYTKVL